MMGTIDYWHSFQDTYPETAAQHAVEEHTGFTSTTTVNCFFLCLCIWNFLFESYLSSIIHPCGQTKHKICPRYDTNIKYWGDLKKSGYEWG